jgi:neurotransmitter:Na+ symporter, NSS family
MAREIFTSRFTAVLTMLGISMGLGNVWRFPYMMGSYGGSAFLIVYLIFTFLFAIPALMAEMALGQMSGRGTVDALRLAFGKKTGNFFGYLLLAVVTIAGSYYAVIVGNVFYSSLFALLVGFKSGGAQQYHALLANGGLQYAVTMVVVLASLFVIYKGLSKGIELISNVVMPFLFATLIYMIVHAFLLPGAIDQCLHFLKPNWQALHATEIFAAMGQAFFSVGLGGTFVVVYAGFFKKDESIPVMAVVTGLGDAGSSLLFSLFLIPSILVFGLNMAAGPTLIFDTFPQLFNSMPGGRWLGPLVLFAIFIVGFLSLVAAYQVPFTSVLYEKPAWAKEKILIVIGVLQAILALPSSLYPNIISNLDLIFGSAMQVVGSGLCIIGLTWGMGRSTSMLQMFGVNKTSVWHSSFYLWLKWIIPLALLSVLIGYIYDVAQ